MADKKIGIRPAKLIDIKDIMTLESGSIAHPWIESEIEKLITDDKKICLVAELDGEIVCYVGADTVLDECNIGNIVTRKDHRGEGFASRLWAELLKLLKNKGMTKVFLEVESDNAPAIALYEESGFVRYGQRRGYYGQGRDAVLMQKDL